MRKKHTTADVKRHDAVIKSMYHASVPDKWSSYHSNLDSKQDILKSTGIFRLQGQK